MAGVHDEAALRALELAVRDALPAWSLPPATRVELLNTSENATFLLDGQDNDRRLVLRVHRPGYHSEAEIRSELAWIVALREQGMVATPAPVAGTNGQFIQVLERGGTAPSPQPPPARGRGGPQFEPPSPRGTGWGTGTHGLAPLTNPDPSSSPPRKRGSNSPPLDSRFRGNDGEISQYPPTLARSAVAFEYVAGHEPRHTDNLTGTFRALGAITAQMHAHARAWARPSDFTRKTWEFRTMLGDRALWGDWRAGPGLNSAGMMLLERLTDCLQRRLARFGKDPDRFGLIHADLRLTNLLVDGDTLTVIDFDDCGFGWFAYDFAASVSFIEDDPSLPDLLAAWLDGYRAVAPLAREDEAEIPTFVMLRRLLLLAWIASHAEAPEAQALGSTYTVGTLALADDFLRRYG